MKQHITPKQLNELSKKGKERLRKWQEKTYSRLGELHPLLSIGQMIQFLGENNIPELSEVMNDLSNGGAFAFEYENLLDSLWEACKEMLND